MRPFYDIRAESAKSGILASVWLVALCGVLFVAGIIGSLVKDALGWSERTWRALSILSALLFAVALIFLGGQGGNDYRND